MEGQEQPVNAVETPEEKDERIRQLEERIAELEKEAHYDGLTNLLNRRGFQKEVESRFIDELEQRAEYEQRERPPEPVNVIAIDLNGFKPINDKHGHEAGDRMLAAVAERLTSELRSSDVIARVGGDEFVVAFAGDEKVRETLRHKVKEVIESTSISVGGKELSVGTSVGAASHEPGEEIGDTVARADDAMYEQKNER